MKILYRPRNSPDGTPFRLGFANYRGEFVEIGCYRGSPRTTTYRTSELEIINQE